MPLKDLDQLYKQTKKFFRANDYFTQEILIPDEFIDRYFTARTIKKGKYITTENDGEFVRYYPHQWFYLAAYCLPYLSELLEFKKIFEQCFPAANIREEIAKNLREEPQKFTNYREQILSNLENKDDIVFLEKFLTDYEWFNGAKGIERNDFWNSSLLNLSNLVHSSSSIFIDICKAYLSSPDLVNMLPLLKNEPIIFEGNIRDIAKKIITFIIDKYGFDHLYSKLDTADNINYKLKVFGASIFKTFNTIQTKEELTSANTLRYFEDYLVKFDDKYWYFTTQWTNTGADKRDFTVLMEFVKNEFPEITIQKINDSKYEVIYLPTKKESVNSALNLIVYGAPGTGKSFDLNKRFPNSIRTVFHSEYSNSDFVGSIRPSIAHSTESKSGQVTYSFIPGPFAKAIMSAYNNSGEMFTLLIEEINRGDAAGIFGEIFQLLDRDIDGSSMYSIDINDGFKEWLKINSPLSLQKNGQLKVPSNLNIVATMNSSDQGVMHLDSAFKRRWRFQYLPINFSHKDVSQSKILYNSKLISWPKFATAINNVLQSQGSIPEDRLIGPFFLRNEEIIDPALVSEKLLLYLWDDVLRIHGRELVFDENIISFSKIQSKFKEGDLVFSELVHLEMFKED